VSPNTIKTHVARLFEKLEARRRTEAIHRARMLGILS
jgi:ATP/maltotriose-dependent transcriptional regulator MalT